MLHIILFSFHPTVTPFLLNLPFFLIALFSKAVSLCSFLKVRNQISYPFQTVDKFVSLNAIIPYRENSVIIFYLFFLLALQPPSGVVFYSPLAGFSLLACEVS